MAPSSSHRPSRALHFCVAVLMVVALSVAAYSGRMPSFVAGHGVDKVVHATMGATLTFLLARALRGRAVLAALLVLVPLAIDEYLQRFSPMRSSDWGDLAADVMGALLAIALHRALSLPRNRIGRWTAPLLEQPHAHQSAADAAAKRLRGSRRIVRAARSHLAGGEPAEHGHIPALAAGGGLRRDHRARRFLRRSPGRRSRG